MSQLRLSLLGPPQVVLDGTPIELGRRKATALLVYLAVTRHEASRDTLATFFWPEHDQTAARAELRRHLSVLNKVLGAGWLDSTGDTIRLRADVDLWLDSETFQNRLSACRQHGHAADEVCADCLPLLTEAVALYRADFLSGFTLRDTPDFDDWQFFEGEQLRTQLAQTLQLLVDGYSQLQTFDRAIAFAQRWLALDPLHEPTHRQLMRLYYWTDQRAIALRQYQQCAQVLDEELGVPPDDETAQLYQQILAQRAIPLPTRNKALSESDHEDAVPGSEAAPLQGTAPSQPTPQTADAVAADDSATMKLSTSTLSAMRIVTVLCVGVGESFENSWLTAPEAATQTLQQLLAEHTQIAQRFGAHVERLGNDTIVARFGTTQMHEDDPERSVHAALEIQAAADQIGWQATMGIHTGHIYLQRDNAHGTPELAVGPVVNQAIRLQMLAQPGDTLVGRRTARLLHGIFVLTPWGTSPDSGREAVDSYRVERLRRQPRRNYRERGGSTQLFGREAELAQFDQILHNLCQQQGHIITIVSEAGVGKSRLIFELQQRLQQNHYPLGSTVDNGSLEILWLEGRCLPMGMSASYWPVIDMLRTYLNLYQEEQLALSPLLELAQPLQHLLTQLVTSGALTTTQCTEIGPLLGNLLAVQFGTEWDQRLQNAGPEQIRHQTLLALRNLFVALAHRQPVAFVIEDLHWADALSLDLIALLMEVLASSPILLVCAYRPETHGGSSTPRTNRLETLATRKCAERYTPLRLRELTQVQSRAMISALTAQGELPSHVAELVLAKGQGNPLFVEELIQALVDSQVIYRKAQQWFADGDAERLTLPDTLQMIVLGRLDRLSMETGHLLRLASVVGRLFQRQVLAQIWSDADALGEQLHQLEAQELIYLERSIPDEEYSFKHILVQEAIYNSLPLSQREQLHLQVARAFEVLYSTRLAEVYEQLAYHYNRSPQMDKAVIYLLATGYKGWHAYLNDEAITAFQSALQHIELLAQSDDSGQHPLDEWRFDALAGLGQVMLGIGDLPAAERYLRQAIALGKAQTYAKERLIPLYQALGEALDWQGQYAARVQVGEDGLALLGDDTESVEAAMINSTVGWGYRACGEAQKARHYLLRNTAFIEQLPYAEGLGSAYVHIVIAYVEYEHDIAKALTWAAIFQRKAARHHDLRALANAHGFVGSDIYWETGDLQRAVTELQTSADLFTKIGDLKQTGLAYYRLGVLSFLLGNLAQAKAYFLRVDEMADALGSIHYLPWMYRTLANTYHCAQAWSQAQEFYQKSIAMGQEIANGAVQALSTYSLACLYQLQERYDEAIQTLHKALTLFLTHVTSHIYWLPEFMHTLEALTPDRTAFLEICNQMQDQLATDSSFTHWYLEPVAVNWPTAAPLMAFHHQDPDKLATQIADGLWTWHDHFGDCAYDLEEGLTIRAANGRYLWYVNQSAPRMTCSANGDMLIQTHCVSASPQTPTIGGLLFWQDAQNYLLLNYGQVGDASVIFSGFVNGQDFLVGRGRLPGTEAYLRLTREQGRVQAFCSADNQTWFTLGMTQFPIGGDVAVGLIALGDVDRNFYHDAHVEGAAIRFLAFSIWR